MPTEKCSSAAFPACGECSDNINSTGWASLYISTNGDFSDEEQAFALGNSYPLLFAPFSACSIFFVLFLLFTCSDKINSTGRFSLYVSTSRDFFDEEKHFLSSTFC